MTLTIGIWRPGTAGEIQKMKHSAGLYGAGVVEVWDMDQLAGLVARLDSELVCLEMDTHAVPLGRFMHPASGFYLVGPQNGSIPRAVLDLGRIVHVETPVRYPLQPHVAAAIVLHDAYQASQRAAVSLGETA